MNDASEPRRPPRVLAVGFFSTIGDLDSLEVLRGWIGEAGGETLVAPIEARVRAALSGAVDPDALSPEEITHVVLVCGPAWEGLYRRRCPFDLRRFAGARFLGLNLTMVRPIAEWNPFHALFERDSERTTRPDLTFLHSRDRVPVIGVCRVHPQPEYGDRQRHALAEEKIERLLAGIDAAVVPLKTVWPPRGGRGRDAVRTATPAAIESLIARMDVVVTMRLHAMVYALKNGVPAVAVDPVEGGGKVLAQARTLGWPHAFAADAVDDAALRTALDACLAPDARADARAAAARGAAALRELPADFLAALSAPPPEAPPDPMPPPRPPKRGLLPRRRRVD